MALPHYLDKLHLQMNTPAAHMVLGQMLYRQSAIVAFMNTYAFIAAIFIFMFPLVFLLRNPKSTQAEEIDLAMH
jgi:hypothetical protein